MERQRTLGSTGLRVSRIGLGLAAVGRPGYINLGRADDLGVVRTVTAMRARTHALLDVAAELRIQYLDVARSYGEAEDFLASWLADRDLTSDDVAVGSKWGYTYVADWQVGAAVNEIKDHTAGTLRRQVAESRARLGPWLGLYQIHSATLESGVLEDRAVLEELARLRQTGLAIGLSVSGPGQPDVIRAATQLRVDGTRLFDAVQATWNVLEPSAGPALDEAHRAGLGVIVKESLANGRLTDRSGDPAVAVLRGLAPPHRAGDTLSVDAIAIAAALAQPWADVVLSGAATPDQLRSNARALDVSLSPEDLAALAPLAIAPTRYWADRAGRPWS